MSSDSNRPGFSSRSMRLPPRFSQTSEPGCWPWREGVARQYIYDAISVAETIWTRHSNSWSTTARLKSATVTGRCNIDPIRDEQEDCQPGSERRDENRSYEDQEMAHTLVSLFGLLFVTSHLLPSSADGR